MLSVRPGKEIYEQEGGWFHARWHFSFDEYQDPNWMGVGRYASSTMTGSSGARRGPCIHTATSSR